jgi:hypothetical protein
MRCDMFYKDKDKKKVTIEIDEDEFANDDTPIEDYENLFFNPTEEEEIEACEVASLYLDI